MVTRLLDWSSLRTHPLKYVFATMLIIVGPHMRAASGDPGKPAAEAVVIAANSLFNIENFRSALIRAIAEQGFRPIVAVPPPPGEHSSMPQDAALTSIRIDRAGLNPLADAGVLAAYTRLLRKVRPVAYLSFTIKPNIYGALAARLANVPSVPNVSGLGTSFLHGGILSSFISKLYRIAFMRSHVVFFQNPDDLKLFLTRKIVRPDQARLLPGSGIDLDRFRPVDAAMAGATTFLFIGRLIADKGVREFVDAAKIVRKRHSEARFQLLGALDPGNRSGIAAEELQSWIDQGLVEHLGQADDVRPVIAAAHAVVLPSYREGLPRSLLEGAAMGKPLIATDVPGNRELVKHRETGLLCNVRDAGSLADAMSEFLEMDSSDQLSLGRAARTLACERFGEQRVIDAYLDVLKPLRRVSVS